MDIRGLSHPYSRLAFIRKHRIWHVPRGLEETVALISRIPFSTVTAKMSASNGMLVFLLTYRAGGGRDMAGPPTALFACAVACGAVAVSSSETILCERQSSIIASPKMQWVSLRSYIQDIHRVPEGDAAALFQGSWRQEVRWIFEACPNPILD